jgi:hypothetical protein
VNCSEYKITHRYEVESKKKQEIKRRIITGSERQAMPRCYILKKHVNQSYTTLKDSVFGNGNNAISYWQPKTTNVALKRRHDTPISLAEANSPICYNNTIENLTGK